MDETGTVRHPGGPRRDSSRERAGGRTGKRPSEAVARAKRSERQVESAALLTLDKFSRGILLVDAHGRVLFSNVAASHILERKDGLRIDQGRLKASEPAAQIKLERYFREGLGVPREDALVLRVDRELADGSYRLLVNPIRQRSRPNGTGPVYTAFVYEPIPGKRPIPVEVLRQLYGLTELEASLANALFVGGTLRQVAKSRGVSINTVRFSLKNVFRKCEVHRQTELLLLLSLGPRLL